MRQLFLIICLFVGGSWLFAQESFFIPTETRYWDSSKAYNGYTLFGSGGTTYLIDMEAAIS